MIESDWLNDGMSQADWANMHAVAGDADQARDLHYYTNNVLLRGENR